MDLRGSKKPETAEECIMTDSAICTFHRILG
jgi:hypothetical protein